MVCDPETQQCKGKEVGSSCNDHAECGKGLACRSSTIWPYETKCLPMAAENSRCETEYDCKASNFCWKLNKDSERVCLEKHRAPDNTQFQWDKDLYPEVTTMSVYAHGKYCQSATAYRVSEDVAECVTINGIVASTNKDYSGSPQPYFDKPQKCKSDGTEYCLYYKGGKKYFELPCECGLQSDIEIGYCPIPGIALLQKNIQLLRQMWLADNCHTYDRMNFKAQRECGIGNNFDVILNVAKTNLELNYYPFVQTDQNNKCVEAFYPQSYHNIFVNNCVFLKFQVIVTVLASVLTMVL